MHRVFYRAPQSALFESYRLRRIYKRTFSVHVFELISIIILADTTTAQLRTISLDARAHAKSDLSVVRGRTLSFVLHVKLMVGV